MSRTEAVRAIGSEKRYADKVKELTEQLAEQQRRAEQAETELEKQKVQLSAGFLDYLSASLAFRACRYVLCVFHNEIQIER